MKKLLVMLAAAALCLSATSLFAQNDNGGGNLVEMAQLALFQHHPAQDAADTDYQTEKRSQVGFAGTALFRFRFRHLVPPVKPCSRPESASIGLPQLTAGS